MSIDGYFAGQTGDCFHMIVYDCRQVVVFRVRPEHL